MTGKSTVDRSRGIIFWSPVIGLIISLVLFALGYYLRGNDSYTSRTQVDSEAFILIYALLGKLSYFYSGIFFLISIAVFVWNSAGKKSLMPEERNALSDLKELSWSEFREYVVGLFQKLDFYTESKGTRDDQYADLRLKKAARTSLVCCRKYYVGKIPLSMVSEFYAAMLKEPALEKGYFITTGSFSHDARKFAADKPLVLIDGEKLMEFVKITESIASAKERSSLQNDPGKMDYACPVCGANMLLKTVENNPHSVTQFWGCSAYPSCKGALRKEQDDLVPFA